MRLAFVALSMLAGGGIIAYIAALIIVPEAPVDVDPETKSVPEASKSEQTSATAENSHGENDGRNGDTPTMI